MTRNISIANQKVNDYLDSLPKRTRSYFIEKAILLLVDFEKGEYIKKSDVESIIKNVLSTLNESDSNDTSNVFNTVTIDNTIKQSIQSILKM